MTDRTPDQDAPVPEWTTRLHNELREIAEGCLSRTPTGQQSTLQPTALVHEAYLKLAGHQDQIQNRAHFLAVAATSMKQLLIDHSRRRRAQKRGGDQERITLSALSGEDDEQLEMFSLLDLLERFAEVDPRACRVFELRYFGGLLIEEIAEVLSISRRTVNGEWAVARAWIGQKLKDTTS